MSDAIEPDEVLQPLPGEPHRDDRDPPQTPRPPLRPVLAGLLLDTVDLATFGPLGVVGAPLGAVAAWFVTEPYELPRRKRVALCVAAGAYCAMPFTSILPLGTLLGFIASRHYGVGSR